MLRYNALRFTAAAARAVSHPSTDDSTSTSFPPHPAESVPPMPVLLKPSSSAHRKPSFYFPRMREEERPSYAFQPTRLGAALPLFNITSSSCEYYALRLPLLKAGFRRVPAGHYDVASNLIWGRSMPFREMLRSSTPSLHFPPVATPEQAAYLDKLTMVNTYQRFNHYPLSHANLGCKRGMATNVRHALQQAEAAATTPGEREAARARYSFMPRTWFYPQEKDSLVTAMKASPPNTHFIWKPARGSCGRGILISDGGERNAASWESVMRQIETKAACKDSGRLFRSYVVQEYIDNPFLVEGRKMDLRLYVGVTSFNPLTVYWHEEGLVRLAAECYADSTGAPSSHIDVSAAEASRVESTNEADAFSPVTTTSGSRVGAVSRHLHDRFRHLTNYSVGRKYVAMQEAMAAASPTLTSMEGRATGDMLSSADGDCNTSGASAPELKWPLQRLWDYVDAQGPHSVTKAMHRPSDKVRENIAQLITRTLMAARPVIQSAVTRVPMPGHYFELFGFDVMLDAELKPYLIEVNTLPSLESSSSFDYATKTNVVADLLNVAMLEPFERKVTPDSSLWNSSIVRGELQEPLGAVEQGLVNSSADGVDSNNNPAIQKLAASREDVQLRLQDELAYARGFQRIFPAKPQPGVVGEGRESDAVPFSPLSHMENPLDVLKSRPAYADDVRYYDRTKLLSPQDMWALEL